MAWRVGGTRACVIKLTLQAAQRAAATRAAPPE